MECSCSFWWPFGYGIIWGVMLALTPSLVVMALLVRKAPTRDDIDDDDDGPTRGT